MQVLSTRKRKDVEVADIKVQVCLFAFDCLYLNGEMLLQRPLTERRAALLEAVEEKPGELQYALYKVCGPSAWICGEDVQITGKRVQNQSWCGQG